MIDNARTGRTTMAVVWLIAAAALTGAVKIAAAQDAPTDTITLTSPNNITIAESDDYATQVLGDPWDMNNLEDLNTPHDYTAAQVGNGVWSATTRSSNGGSVHLQYQNFPNSYSYIGEKDGVNYPVDANRFQRLWVRMYSAQPGLSLLFFFKHYTYSAAGNSDFFQVQPGWHIYSVDLRQDAGGGSGTWTQNGPYAGLRLDAPWGANNNLVQYDWARLTPDTGQAVNIAWNYTGAGTSRVKLYLSHSADPNADNEYLIADVAASSRAYTWNTTGVAPATYYVHAEMNGAASSSGALTFNTSPLVKIDAPGPLTGEDFAQRELLSSWNPSTCGQFQYTSGVGSLSCDPSGVQGQITNNDPQLLWLNRDYAHPIDTARYRYMNVKFKLLPPAVRPWSPFNAGTRMTWDVGSQWAQSEIILAQYNVWINSAWDMKTVPRIDGGSGWTGSPTTLRFDLAEQDDADGQPDALPAGFQFESAHLTSDPTSGQGTIIRWTALQGSGMVDLFWDQNAAGYNGTAIARSIPIAQGSYVWNTATLANGTYYVYIVVHDTYNTSRVYSLVPLIVNHSGQSTLFTDVPTNHWAAAEINEIALKGIVNGVRQNDSTVLFSPGNSAFRSHLSKMVVLAAGIAPENPTIATFHDVAPGSSFYSYIEAAALHGIISGYPCGGPGEPCGAGGKPYFRPSISVTRGQLSKMLARSLSAAGTAK